MLQPGNESKGLPGFVTRGSQDAEQKEYERIRCYRLQPSTLAPISVSGALDTEIKLTRGN